MKAESFLNGLNPSTADLYSSGGGGWDALIHGDRVAIMMACDAPDLIWAYAFSYNNTGLDYDMYRQVGYKFNRLSKYDEEMEQEVCLISSERQYERVKVSCSLDAFAYMLKPWIYKNFYDWLRYEDNQVKRINLASEASEKINKGLALYLSTKPKEEVRMAKYFKPIPSTTFDRNYKKFAIKASRILFSQLNDLKNQIEDFTENEQNI